MFTKIKAQWLGAVLVGVLAGSTAPALAANTVSIHSNPTHLEAPATEVFIVRVPDHSGLVPSRADVSYVGKSAHYKMALKKAAKDAWGGSVYAAVPGTLAVSVYSRSGELLTTQDFPVTKAKESWVPRIIIGVLFIGIALWYWRRMQSVTNPQGRRPR